MTTNAFSFFIKYYKTSFCGIIHCGLFTIEFPTVEGAVAGFKAALKHGECLRQVFTIWFALEYCLKIGVVCFVLFQPLQRLFNWQIHFVRILNWSQGLFFKT